MLERARTLLRLKGSLTEWCISCGYVPARHHALIIEGLQALESGAITKLMLFLPPGSAKSTYSSVLFVPWYLSRNPTHSVLAASHSEELAERWGRRCRNLIDERSQDLGINVSETNRAAGRWQLAPTPAHPNPLQMGEYLAAGAGSAIAGFRGDLGLIDDPVKSRDDVKSETQRQRLWDWYTFDYRPRLKPGAKQCVIMTRWHEDDLAARLLAEAPDDWHVISLPMLSESLSDPLGRALGERLWPDWFTDQMVGEAMRDPVVWNSLYQQRPSAEEGSYWRREWLMPVSPHLVPPRSQLKVYGGSDYAVSADKGDYTVHAVIGLDPQDKPWILDIWRERTTSDVWIDAWCSMVRHYKPMSWAEETGQILAGVGPFLEREQLKRKAFTERIQFPSRADKGSRAQSMRAHVATHGLWYATDLPERAALEAELLAFPQGKHDDMHDALGICGQLLDMAIHGRLPKKPSVKTTSGYKPLVTTGRIDTARYV